MSPEAKERIAKVLALAKAGATDGEKQAAEKALTRLIKKYNINPDELDTIHKSEIRLKYTTDMELWLMARLIKCLLQDNQAKGTRYLGSGKKEVVFQLDYLDRVTLEASYEYFRRHMKEEWKKACAKEVARCRKAKTKNKRRAELQGLFFNSYCIASKLYQIEELISIDLDSISQKEREDRQKLQGIEGGQYRKQMTNGLLLEMT
jgi:hypothetical protein